MIVTYEILGSQAAFEEFESTGQDLKSAVIICMPAQIAFLESQKTELNEVCERQYDECLQLECAKESAYDQELELEGCLGYVRQSSVIEVCGESRRSCRHCTFISHTHTHTHTLIMHSYMYILSYPNLHVHTLLSHCLFSPYSSLLLC